MSRLKQILKDTAGISFPFVVAIALALIIILCGVMEFFRLNIIATGVKEALEDAIIVTVNDNYADVYHGVREGYSGGYRPDGESFSYSVNTGDIYSYMDGTLGTEDVGGRHFKTAGGVTEYILSGLSVTISNAPLAPSDPRNAQRFEADATIWVEVPVQFGGKQLMPLAGAAPHCKHHRQQQHRRHQKLFYRRTGGAVNCRHSWYGLHHPDKRRLQAAH